MCSIIEYFSEVCVVQHYNFKQHILVFGTDLSLVDILCNPPHTHKVFRQICEQCL